MKRILFFLPLLSFAATPVFRVASEAAISTIHMAAQGAVFSADGSRLAYLSNGHLFVMDVATRVTRDAGAWGRAGEMLAFAPDGKSMYIGQGQTLYQRSIEGPDDRRKILEHVWITPEVSPDGKTLSFLRLEQRSTVVILANPDGSHERRLTVIPSQMVRGAWLADSSAIALKHWVLDGAKFRIFLSIMSRQSPAEPRQISELDAGSADDMIWSADGSGFFASYGDRAGPDRRTLAAKRTRVVRTFWDSLLGMVGMSTDKVEEDLVLLRIEGK